MFSQFDGAPFPCKGHICLWLISPILEYTQFLSLLCLAQSLTQFFLVTGNISNHLEMCQRSLHELSGFPTQTLCVTFGECDMEIRTSRLSGVQWLTQCHPRFSSWQNQGLNLSLLLSESMVFVIACVTLIRRAQQKALAVDWLELSRLYWKLSKLKWLALQY